MPRMSDESRASGQYQRTPYQGFRSNSALVEEYLRQFRQEAGEAQRTPDTTPRAQRQLRLTIRRHGRVPERWRRPHFDVVAAARTASLTAVGVIATTAFWVRLTMSSR